MKGSEPGRKTRGLKDELARIEAMKQYEYQAYEQGYQLVAGLDEVGRGPIAGPVMAAGVILAPGFFLAGVNDSKKLSAARRSELAVEIKRMALAWSVAAVYPPYLDHVNILQATREAMMLCIAHLSPRPDYLLIDALKLPDINIKQYALIKGDSLSVSIACASILAKVERDRAMDSFDSIYPGYHFCQHKGYATREHLQMVFEKGPCAIHRGSFEPVKTLLRGGHYAKQPGLFDQDDI